MVFLLEYTQVSQMAHEIASLIKDFRTHLVMVDYLSKTKTIPVVQEEHTAGPVTLDTEGM